MSPLKRFHSQLAGPTTVLTVGTRPARKRPITVDVWFATQSHTLQTAEGRVQVRPGDAVLTGLRGERWRVTRVRFDARYAPLPPLQTGQDGRYRSLPLAVQALCMDQAFEVLLSDGVSLLHGAPGDWLIDYGDGSLGVVAGAWFADLYELP